MNQRPGMGPHVTIVGLGLIGGSLGKALIRQGWNVSFIDPGVEEAQARHTQAATVKLRSVDDVPPGSLVVLATPVDVALSEIETFPSLLNPITSVCSIMEPLQSAAAARGYRFVAGHPLAGSHRHGLDAADWRLFEGKTWFLAEGPADTDAARMAEAVGGRVHRVDATEHDRSVALTSHLPQLLSTALAAMIDRSGVDVERFAGTGLQTFLRLARSGRSVWEPVFELNGHMEEALREFERLAERLRGGEAEEAWEGARRTSEKLGIE